MPPNPTELANALRRDDVELMRGWLANPEVRSLIHQPIGPFDTFMIHHARSPAMLDLLVDAGADLNARSQWWAGGFGLLDWASPELSEHALRRGAVLDVHSAARLGKVDVLRRLLDEDPARVHARGGDGQTPLHFAGTLETANLLLERGADPDAEDVDHESTPAQYMIRDRQPIARHLVGRGCRTDLLMAAALGDADLVARHLDANPESIRMTVSERWFPKRNPQSGGTIYTWTLGEGKSPHAIALEFGHPEVFQLLIERTPAEWKVVFLAEAGRLEEARALLRRNPGLLSQSAGEEPERIHAAAGNARFDGVRTLLELGWPKDARGRHGETLLHWAAFHGDTATTKWLLERGVPIEVSDTTYHATPLGWALHGSRYGWRGEGSDYPGTVEMLLEAGAAPPPEEKGSEAVRAVLRRRKARGG